MLDFDIINKMYPKAFVKYIGWLNSKIPKNGRSIYFSDSYLYYDKGTTTNLFNNNARDLFDFFDDYNIHIEVYKEQVLGNDTHYERWCFDIGLIISKGYVNRRLAEGAAFKQGFRILNKEL